MVSHMENSQSKRIFHSFQIHQHPAVIGDLEDPHLPTQMETFGVLQLVPQRAHAGPPPSYRAANA